MTRFTGFITCRGRRWKSREFDRDLAEQLLRDIERNPGSTFRMTIEGLLLFPSLSDPVRNPLVTFGTEDDPVRVFADLLICILSGVKY